MIKISEWIRRISTGRVTLLCLVIFLLFTALVLPGQSALAEETSGGAGSPDTSLFLHRPLSCTAWRKLTARAGRAAYIHARFTFDLVFPLVYTAFLATAISWLFSRGFTAGQPLALANLAPILGAIFDYLENFSAALVMGRYPALTPVVDWLAPVFTFIKWVSFVGGSFALLVIGIFAVNP